MNVLRLCVIIISMLILVGCTNLQSDTLPNNDAGDSATKSDSSILNIVKQEEITKNNQIDIYSEKQNLTMFIQYKNKKIDCNVNSDIDNMDVEIEIFDISQYKDNPSYMWYSNLNEGKIRHIAWFAQNKGCSKIYKPQIFVNIFKGDKLIYHEEPNNLDLMLDYIEDYIYPLDNAIGGNHQIQKVVNEKGDYILQIIIFDGNSKKLVGGNQVILSLN